MTTPNCLKIGVTHTPTIGLSHTPPLGMTHTDFEATEAYVLTNLKLYLGDDNSLYYPSESMTIGAFRAYFQLNGLNVSDTETTTGAAIRNFVLNLDDEDSHATAIDSVTEDAPRTRTAEGWFTLDGRRLTEKPTQKGVYIHDGKKVFFY